MMVYVDGIRIHGAEGTTSAEGTKGKKQVNEIPFYY
jgi:hypothetical protein